MTQQLIQYNNAYFYPPISLSPANGAIVTGLFNRLKGGEDLDADKLFQEIASLVNEPGYVFDAITYDPHRHDAKVHDKFPVVWDTKKNDGLDDKQKRAATLSGRTNNKMFLSLAPSTVIVGYCMQPVGKPQPFMIVTGKVPEQGVPGFSCHPAKEMLQANGIDIGFHPEMPGFISGMLYHDAVKHLKKECLHPH